MIEHEEMHEKQRFNCKESHSWILCSHDLNNFFTVHALLGADLRSRGNRNL